MLSVPSSAAGSEDMSMKTLAERCRDLANELVSELHELMSSKSLLRHITKNGNLFARH